MTSRLLLKTLLLLFIGGFVSAAWGHNISAENAEFVLGLSGAAPGPFLNLGAKHLFIGYDHLLFLLGVIFFLYRPRDIILYVTLFTVGHSITLLLGVFFSWQVNGTWSMRLSVCRLFTRPLKTSKGLRRCRLGGWIRALLFLLLACVMAWAWPPSYKKPSKVAAGC